MGNAWADFDNDGDPDIGIAAVTPLDPNFLYTNDGDGTFTPATTSAGIVVEPGSSTSAILFADYDNDGWLDLLLTEVELGTAKILPHRVYLFRNRGDGTFEDVTAAAGVMPPLDGNNEYWDAAFADYDNDGDLDLYVLQRNTLGIGTEPGFLMQNQSGGNHWLQIDLRGTDSNRDGIGARIIVTAAGLLPQLREVNGGEGFFDQHTRIQQFGLGPAETADVEVRWPGGTTQLLPGVAADQRLVIEEPGGDDPPDDEDPPSGDDPCPGDLDGDGRVRGHDVFRLLARWGSSSDGPPDFDGDGVVHRPDLRILLDHRGLCPESPASTAAPRPRRGGGRKGLRWLDGR